MEKLVNDLNSQVAKVVTMNDHVKVLLRVSVPGPGSDSLNELMKSLDNLDYYCSIIRSITEDIRDKVEEG